MKDYKKLNVWLESKDLATQVIKKVNCNKSLNFSLADQVIRSAFSCPSNIAEGLGRSGLKDKMKFLIIARASLFELETQLIIINEMELMVFSEAIFNKINTVAKLINGMIRYLNQSYE